MKRRKVRVGSMAYTAPKKAKVASLDDRIDTIAKGLLRLAKDTETRLLLVEKQLKNLNGKVSKMEREVAKMDETNKKIERDVEKLHDLVGSGFYDLKAKMGSEFYSLKSALDLEVKKERLGEDRTIKIFKPTEKETAPAVEESKPEEEKIEGEGVRDIIDRIVAKGYKK